MGYNDSVRRSQLIVPFGIGAMVDFPEDTLMTAGVDFWPYELAVDDEQKKPLGRQPKFTMTDLETA